MDSAIAQYLLAYHSPAIFFGAFFFGETVILTAAFLATQGWWTIKTVFWLSLFGTLASDVLWFWAGHYVFHRKDWFAKHKEKYTKVVHFLDRKIGDRPYVGLLIIKFLYGTRVLTIIYLAVRRVNFWKFLLFDTLGTVLWLFVVVPIGYFAGKGIGNVDIFSNLSYVLTGLVASIILFRLISVWISKKVIKEE